jgi:hypothetical protein
MVGGATAAARTGEGEEMRIGLKSILLIVAIVLFLLEVFTDGFRNGIPLGLAAFAAAFLVEGAGWRLRR